MGTLDFFNLSRIFLKPITCLFVPSSVNRRSGHQEQQRMVVHEALTDYQSNLKGVVALPVRDANQLHALRIRTNGLLKHTYHCNLTQNQDK